MPFVRTERRLTFFSVATTSVSSRARILKVGELNGRRRLPGLSYMDVDIRVAIRLRTVTCFARTAPSGSLGVKSKSSPVRYRRLRYSVARSV